MHLKILESCREALSTDDLFTIQHCVDSVTRWMVETDAPDEVRLAFSQLLESTADKTCNRVVAVYLRSLAGSYATPSLDRPKTPPGFSAQPGRQTR